MIRLRSCLVLLASTVSSGCGDTGQQHVAVPLFVAGTDVAEPLTATGGVSVVLDRADLAFGPLYLCAGATAGDLCDTARLEWLETIVVDTIEPTPVRAGRLVGTTGPVRSWMYDLGISSQLTDSEPFVLDAARELDGASFVVEGRATVNEMELHFLASVPVRQGSATELGVPVIRKGTDVSFDHEVTTADDGLVLRFDPVAWVRAIDFRPFVADHTCTPEGPAIACAGAVESTCDSDGAVLSVRDCLELDQMCIPSLGCTDELTLGPESEAYRSLAIALTTTGRPTFTWGPSP